MTPHFVKRDGSSVLDIANEALTCGDERRKLLAEIAQLKQELADCRQTIEDVACGSGINCIKCGKDARWCNCK